MPYTANKKINALDLAPAPLGDTDAVPMVRAGVTYQTPLSAVEAKVFSSKTSLSTAPLGTEAVILRQGDGSLRQTTTSSLIPDGNITNTQIGATAAIADTKLATIATAGKVSNSATTATSANTANAIVARDGSGNFSAGTIAAATSGTHTGPVVGNASTATALQTARAISMTGAVTATGVNFDGSAAIALNTAIAALPDSSLATITTAGKVSGNAITSGTIGGSTAINTTGTITSGTITANLTGNASTATTLQNARTIALSGDVTGTATSFNGGANITIASAITGDSIVNADINSAAAIADTKLATISTAGKVSNSATTATSANTASAIVTRDASGNFSAGTITATSFVGSGASLTGIVGIPSGAVMPFAMNSAPTGWLAANGTEYSKTGIYATLFAAIGVTYGETNGAGGAGNTHFRVPDLRASFVRGAGSDGVATAGTFGAKQADSYLNHTHGITDPGHFHSVPTGAFSGTSQSGGGWTNVHGATSTGTKTTGITVNISTTGGTETRPRNIAMLYCIKT
jgi:hypothetical protein